TKSKKRREIPLDPMLAEILREHRTNQNKIRQDMGPDWNPQHLVFTTQNGTPINRSNFYNRVWKPLHDEFNASLRFGDAPLPYLNIHGLRHTFGTIFVRAGGDAKMGAEIFGHHSTAFFQDQYVHPNVEDKRRELSKFSSRLRRVSG